MKNKFLMMTTLTAAASFALFMVMPSSGQDGPPAQAPGGAKGGGGAPGGGAPGGGGGRGGGKGGPGGGGAARGGGAPAAPAGPMARTPDGHPDFTGYWNLPEPPATGIEPAPPRGGGAPGGGGGAGGAAAGGGRAGGGGGAARGGGAPGGGDQVAIAGPGGAPARGGAPGGGAPGGARGGGGGRGNIIIDPPDGKIPYTAEARAKAEDLIKNHLADEPELNCYESGVPHTESNRFGAQIIQMPGYLVQMNEFLHSVRVIPIDPNRHHIDAKYHLFQGDPIAHWEGDTLVVDTTNQNDKTWFDLYGNFKTTNLHVTEKFIPTDANTITYEATMHDPTIYTRDWTVRWNITKLNTRPYSDGHPYELMEFACIEGNQDPQHYTSDTGGKAKPVLGAKK